MIIDKLGFYRTRGGKKVRVVCLSGVGEYTAIGQFEDGILVRWKPSGLFYGVTFHPNDLVSVWQDKPIVQWDALPAWADRWFAADGDGRGHCFLDKPVIEDNTKWKVGWISKIRNISVEVPFEYFTYTGDWRESLVENPKYAEEK